MHPIQQQVRTLVRKETELKQRAEISLSEKRRLVEEISKVNMFLARKDDMLASLNAIQQRAQAKNKGMFEDLLTSLVQEVMPGKDDKVVLTSTMNHNRSSLEIDIMSEGHLENVEEDKGGSIANIIAMGLRFIVLARHPNRRVLLLDESDCHLRAEYIPAFAGMMHQMSIRMGIQVIYISHHPESNFLGYGRVIELYKEGKQTCSRIISDAAPMPEDYETPDTAFRYIRLKNFGPHENTLIDLSPGLNVLTGDNDLGKSKFIQSVVELMENDGKERRIHRGASFFEVELGLEEGMSLRWRYQKSGKNRTSMTLLDRDGEELETSNQGKGIPEWLDSYLAMPLVNGENIHFNSQKKCNYLVSNDYTGGQRAAMLPLGRESRDVQRMIQLFNAKLQEARQAKKRLEQELNRHENMLATMSLIIENPFDEDALHARCDHLLESMRNTAAIGALIDHLDDQSSLVDIYKLVCNQISLNVMNTVELTLHPELERTISSLEQCSAALDAIKKVEDLPEQKSAPELHDLDGIIKTGSALKGMRDLLDSLNQANDLPKIEAPEVKDTDSMEAMIKALDDIGLAKKRLSLKEKELKQEKDAVENELSVLIERLGGVCPSCQQTIGEGVDHVHHG